MFFTDVIQCVGIGIEWKMILNTRPGSQVPVGKFRLSYFYDTYYFP